MYISFDEIWQLFHVKPKEATKLDYGDLHCD